MVYVAWNNPVGSSPRTRTKSWLAEYLKSKDSVIRTKEWAKPCTCCLQLGHLRDRCTRKIECGLQKQACRKKLPWGWSAHRYICPEAWWTGQCTAWDARQQRRRQRLLWQSAPRKWKFLSFNDYNRQMKPSPDRTATSNHRHRRQYWQYCAESTPKYPSWQCSEAMANWSHPPVLLTYIYIITNSTRWLHHTACQIVSFWWCEHRDWTINCALAQWNREERAATFNVADEASRLAEAIATIASSHFPQTPTLFIGETKQFNLVLIAEEDQKVPWVIYQTAPAPFIGTYRSDRTNPLVHRLLCPRRLCSMKRSEHRTSMQGMRPCWTAEVMQRQSRMHAHQTAQIGKGLHSGELLIADS